MKYKLSKSIQATMVQHWEKEVRCYDWWFRAGIVNLQIAKLLLNKYEDSYKKYEKHIFNNRERLTKEDLVFMETSRLVVMFYGYALECYMKGYLISKNRYDNLNRFHHHNLDKFYKQIFSEEKINPVNIETLEKLKRAINSGKYPFEKNFNPFSYVTNMQETVAFCLGKIEQIKILQDIANNKNLSPKFNNTEDAIVYLKN